MPPLRISAISFLNTAPLMWDFENGETAEQLRQHFEISYTIPSHCAEQLKEGSADIGIIPVAAYTVIPDLVIVPDVAIAAKNKVRSILLVSKVAINKIRSVATDDSSRTSAALVEIYLRKFVGLDPGFTRQKPSLKEMLQWHDAALLIGDPALQARTDGYFVYDLAEEWKRWTGRPFVFAFWAVRRAALEGRAGRAKHRAGVPAVAGQRAEAHSRNRLGMGAKAESLSQADCGLPDGKCRLRAGRREP